MIDDDFELVKSMTGGCRTIRRHEEILSIIENGARVALDLGVSTFTWTRNYNPIMVNAVAMPFKPVGQLAGAFGVIGSAKHRLMDPACSGRNGPDLTLATLLVDRVIICDQRFYFQCGTMFGGIGGNTGLIDDQRFSLSTRRLKEKWGKHIVFGKTAKGKCWNKNRSLPTCKISVVRRSTSSVK